MAKFYKKTGSVMARNTTEGVSALLLVLILEACASGHRAVVKTVGEAVRESEERGLESGVYLRKKTGENLYLEVTNLRRESERLEAAQLRLKRELDYWRRGNGKLAELNDGLRISQSADLESDLELANEKAPEPVAPNVKKARTIPGAPTRREVAEPVELAEIEEESTASRESGRRPPKNRSPASEPVIDLPAPMVEE